MLCFGILGFGRHAVKRLMPGFAHAQNCRVVALSRRTLDSARRSADDYGIPLAFDSPEDLCSFPEVDAIFVTSPDALHLPHVTLALARGKHVLCEKPMAMHAEECRQMLDAAQKANRILGVAHVFRFEPSVRRVRAIVAAGEIGTVREARVEFHYMALSHPRTWITDAALACGGPMADVGVHCIDALRFILQDEIASVKVTAEQDEYSGAFEASAVLHLRFTGGASGRIEVSSRQEYRSPLEIIGTAGHIRGKDVLSVDQPTVLEILSKGQLRTEPYSNEMAYAFQVDAFADAVAGKAEFSALGIEGLQNQLVLDAAYSSWRSGKTEAIPTQ